ncbi:hypothetical protein [Nocardia crassostreae]|uniref:hypothetical protein n=1 Tax=Nocardia crassostreae TaxID=53428 RepID=UPI0012FA1173|nr:hypothetical protein [Nocardia crassostreae]
MTRRSDGVVAGALSTVHRICEQLTALKRADGRYVIGRKVADPGTGWSLDPGGSCARVAGGYESVE